MKTLCAAIVIGILVIPAALQAATVGEPGPPMVDGTPDGWSLVVVMSGYGGLPAGELVSTVNYYASVDRAAGEHHLTPLIVQESGGDFSIWDIGPSQNPTAVGDHAFAWGSAVVPNDGNAYHPGFWEWREGFDNDAGGVIPFGGAGGSGMFALDQPETYEPAIGDPVTAQHASGADGRSYQFNFETVPEPGTFVLLGLGLFGFFAVARRFRT